MNNSSSRRISIEKLRTHLIRRIHLRYVPVHSHPSSNPQCFPHRESQPKHKDKEENETCSCKRWWRWYPKPRIWVKRWYGFPPHSRSAWCFRFDILTVGVMVVARLVRRGIWGRFRSRGWRTVWLSRQELVLWTFGSHCCGEQNKNWNDELA